MIPGRDEGLSRRLASVIDLAEAEDWDRAIDLLESIQISGGDQLVPVDNQHLLNASLYARVMLTQLPAGARERYRERYERRAEAWMKQADETGDLSFLTRILEEAFLTRTAERAIDRLAEEALRAGQFSTARKYWTMLVPLEQSGTLLVRYPDPETPLPDVLARLIVCRLLEGHFDRAEYELSVFAEEFPDAPGRLAGEPDSWVNLLTRLKQSLMEQQQTESVPTGHAASVPPDVGAPYWSLPLYDKKLEQLKTEELVSDKVVNGLTLHPVIWKDLVFWNARDWIVAYDFKSGRGAWLETDPKSAQSWREQGRIFPTRTDPFNFQPDRPVHGFLGDGVTISRGRLYARMAGPVTAYADRETRVQPSRLVCLDLQESQGLLLWDLDAADLDPHLRFEGAPLIRDDRLWILARRGLIPSEVHLVCLDAQSGRFLWNRLICANSPRVPEGANLASSLRINHAESTLVVCTELGCIAAFDEADGQPLWYRTYPRSMDLDGVQASPDVSPGCVIHEGIVFAAPHDSDQLLALDLLTGETIWTQTRPPDHRVWGVAQDRIITSGQTLEARHIADGQLEWSFSARTADLRGRGAGLVTDRQIWWPTPTQILVFQARDGRILRRIDLSVSRQLQGGNLTATPEGLVISSPDRVTVLSPWGRMPELPPESPEPGTGN